MKTWYIPSMCGDFRLEAAGESKSVLVVSDPTPKEAEQLTAFMREAVARHWLGCMKANVSLLGTSTVKLKAAVAETGPVLARACGLEDRLGVLTAVMSANGQVTAFEKAIDAVAAAAKAAPSEKPPKAATVTRPTPCCPDPYVRRDTRASEVLAAFCTPEQRESWTRDRYLEVQGGITGHWYRLAHRHSPRAVRQGRICLDLTDGQILHFHHSLLPPAEEVLSAMLILAHREPWLRHQATCLGGRHTDVFENPLGPGIEDGIADAEFTEAFGRQAQRLLKDLTAGAMTVLSTRALH